MANATKKDTTKNVQTKKTTKKVETTKVDAAIVDDTNVKVGTTKVVKPTIKKKTIIKIPVDEEFVVRSNVFGSLYFESRQKDLVLEWDNSGDEEYVTYGDLNKIRNQSKAFFEKNWIVIDGNDSYSSEDVYKALRMDKFYQSYLTPDDIDELFDLDTNDIARLISTYTDGMKETIKTRAKELVDEGALSDMGKIKILSEMLNADFGVGLQ